jgi:hypothetical protein
MLFGFRGHCLDCGHQWDWLRSRIACGHIDFHKPETYRSYCCPRCFVELDVPRRLNRSSWLRWVSENASELTHSPLHFRTCELGVRVDRQALEVIARSPLLFKACECVASILAGTRSPYVPVSIDIGPMECPQCGDDMAIGDFDTNPLVCPECESPSTRSIKGHAHATCLVDYWPLDGDEIRRVIRHLKEMADHSRGSLFKGEFAVPVSEGRAPLWDRDLDGWE